MLLVVLGRQTETTLNASLERVDLSLRLFGALGHLARQPGLSYTALAGRARVTPQSMHATIATLIEAGAVLPAGTGRGRRALLEVTPHGHELLAAGQEAIAGVDARLEQLGGLPADHELARIVAAMASPPDHGAPGSS